MPLKLFLSSFIMWMITPWFSVAHAADLAPHCVAMHIEVSDPQAYLPDPTCTPGSIDPRVTQENLNTTICKSGYTKEVRPSSSYTTTLKKKQIIEYGYEDTNLKNYEEDHLVSLELGGSPSDPKNLWPEPHPSLNEKDTIENYLKAEICSGHITLARAQYDIAHNWYDLYLRQKPAPATTRIKDFLRQIILELRSFFSEN